MSLQFNQIIDYTPFQTNGLTNVEKALFSPKNLIIGKNGSGKTRFLKTLEHEKKLNNTNNHIVITLYFSEIQAFYNSEQPKLQEAATETASQEIYPFDLLLEQEEGSFYDFLKAMEKDKAGFLENFPSLLIMKGTRKSTIAKKTLADLNSLLTEFIGKQIRIDQENTQIYIEKAEHEKVTRTLPLKEALAEFSPGELMLFYLCVFLMIVKRNHPRGIVLIIDEPELHLHPRALVKMIQTLKESENVSELWIASHSLFLVPLFAFEEIIFLEQNTVYCRNSHLYKDLYDSLVGLENVNLFEFLKSLDSWQYYQFIAECFCLPEPVGKADPKDEQFCKLMNSIKARQKGKPIQMLDYGAGKCRIWECMQLLPDSDFDKTQVVYTAYEPYPEDLDQKPFKLYKDFSDIHKDNQSFHVIVLMNVLHEIDGNQWEQTFQNIKSVLTDDGILFFLEVLSLTKGEQPYGNNGYLVLQDEQVKVLFGDKNIINIKVDPKEKSNCWIITRKQLENVTKNSIMESIDSLRNRTYESLKTEFQQRIDYAHGNTDNHQKQITARKYAFLSQQYINALLTSSSLKKGSEKTRTQTDVPTNNKKSANESPIKVTGVRAESF